MALMTLAISGIPDAIKVIKRLENFQKKRTKIISILRASAKPLLKAMKDGAPSGQQSPHDIRTKKIKKTVTKGSLKRSHGIMRVKNRNLAAINVGYRTGKKAGKNEGFYGLMVNKGFGAHNKNPYIANAVKSKRAMVLATVSKRLAAEIRAQL